MRLAILFLEPNVDWTAQERLIGDRAIIHASLAIRIARPVQDLSQLTVCLVLGESTCSPQESASATGIAESVSESLGKSVPVATRALIWSTTNV